MRRPIFLLVLGLTLVGSAAPAADLLFVLTADSKAFALDAETLDVAATPDVGPDARAAARAYDAASGEAKTYVLEDAGVRVLDERFETVALIPLPAPPVGPGPALAVNRRAGRLAVATEAGVLLIDTARDAVDTFVETDGVPAALVAGPRYLYLLDAGSVVRRIDPADGRLLPGGLPLPPGVTLAAAPDGSRAYATGKRGLLPLSEAPDAAFVDDPKTSPALAPARAARVAAGWGGRSLWMLDGALQVSSPQPGGRLRSLAPTAQARDFALSSDGRMAYLADADSVRALDVETGDELAVAALDVAPSAVFFSPEPVEGQDSIIQKVSPDPFVVEGSMFQLQVDGPIGGVPLTVSASPAIVACTPPPGGLNGLTTIDCEAGDVAATTQSTVTVSASGLGSVSFIVTVFPAGLPDGVNPIGATSPTVAPGAEFQLAVEYRQGGSPAPGVQLTVVEGPSAAASCPATVNTNASGIATVTCTATSPEQSVSFTVTISDGMGSQAVFNVTVTGTGGAGGTLIKVTPEPINVLENANFSLTVEAHQDGLPEPGVTLQVQSSSGAVQCPSEGTTGSNGRVLFACGAGEVNQTTSVTVTIREGTVRQVAFTVTVIQTAADGLSIAGNNNQIVQQGTALPLPLLVAARSNGEPQEGLQLFVTTEPEDLLTCFGPVFTDASGLAEIDCSAGTVQGQTEVAVQVSDTLGRMLAAPFSVIITPNAVGQATQLEALSALEIEADAGATVQQAIRVRALNEDGLPVPGAFVHFRSADPGVQFADTPVVTNANGVATATITFDCPVTPGTIQVGLTSQTTLLTFTYRLRSGPLSALVIDQGDNQSGDPGQRLPLALVVRAEDACGARIPGVAVEWAVEPVGAASIEATVSVTDSRGRSSTLVRVAPSRFDPFQVTATTGELSAMFNVSVANAPANLTATSGGGQQVPARTTAAQPLVATVTNEGGSPVAGVEVEFVVVTGEGSVMNPVTQTDAQGRASALIEAGSMLGPLTVEARAIGQTVSFALTVIGEVPAVVLDSFTNGGSFRPGWTPGSAASIFGTGMMEGVDGIETTPFPFPNRYKGVEVRVNGVAAPLFALIDQNGGQQINLQVPFGVAPGLATVEIFNNGSSRVVTGVPINRVQPGIFEIFVEGGRYAAALHKDFSVVTPSNPARPGEAILLFLTGVGPTDQALETNVPGPANPLARVTETVVVGLENRGVQVLGAFYAPGLVSVYQINFRVGPNASDGDLNLNVRVGDAFSQVVLLPVRR